MQEPKEEPFDDFPLMSSGKEISNRPMEILKEPKEEPIDLIHSFAADNQINFVEDDICKKEEILDQKELFGDDIPKEEPRDIDCPSTAHVVIARNAVVTRVVTNSIPCSFCGEIFKFRFQVENHMQEKHVLPVYPPRTVETHNIEVRDLRKDQSRRGHTMQEGCFFDHKYTKQGPDCRDSISFIECEVCTERFPNARDHRIHAMKSHPSNKEERLCKNEYCVRVRSAHNPAPLDERAVSPYIHTLLSPMYQPLVCPMCPEKYLASYFHLYSHYSEKHAMEFKLLFVCKGCSRTYTSPTGLRKHILSESERVKCCNGSASFLLPTRRRKRLAGRM